MFRLKTLPALIAFAVLAGCNETDKPSTVTASPSKSETKIITGNEELPSNHPPIPSEPPADHASIMEEVAEGSMLRSGPSVTVPDSVSGQWSAVRLAVTNKEGKRHEVLAELDTALPLGEGNLNLRAHSFLPSYMSDSDRISSRSNELENPAVLVALLRDEQIINEGWVFRDYPQFNTFASHLFQIELIEAEPVGQKDPVEGGET